MENIQIKVEINFTGRLNFYKIFIGILTNIVAYVPVFVLIQLFSRTSCVWSKSQRLEKLIRNSESSLNKNNSLTKESKTMSITFPWWFKIFLYLFSFIVMASSIVLVTFKGIFFTNLINFSI
jgi:hypothetical protein